MHATPGPLRATALALSVSALGFGALVGLTAVPAVASGGGDDVRTHGACSGTTDWKMKAKSDDGKVEVEAEIDSNKVGQTWNWKLKDNGTLVSAGTSTDARLPAARSRWSASRPTRPGPTPSSSAP